MDQYYLIFDADDETTVFLGTMEELMVEMTSIEEPLLVHHIDIYDGICEDASEDVAHGMLNNISDNDYFVWLEDGTIDQDSLPRFIQHHLRRDLDDILGEISEMASYEASHGSYLQEKWND